MTEVAILKIILVAQGGLFLLVTLVVWQKMETQRLALLRLGKAVGVTVEVKP
jgi:hypothetical protein